MLHFNELDRSFFLETQDSKRAEQAGLTLSRSIRGANGEKIYYTSDYNKQPQYNPYAVLPFWQEADDRVTSELKNLIRDYKDSWLDYSEDFFPCPIDRSYLPYQKAGIANALRRTNSIIGDEMGLGKTVSAIGFIFISCGNKTPSFSGFWNFFIWSKWNNFEIFISKR